MQSNQPTGERYRWISEEGNERAVNEDGYTITGTRYGGRGVTLYGNGEAVAVIYSSSVGNRTTYLGKDLLGSVRSTTAESGLLEERYEYDAFGQPYAGDLSGGMNLGYLEKPYETATGLYNYGYRDYQPQAARFTTVDPIRDGNNWYVYVNNDPINYVDLWGLRDVYYYERTDTIINKKTGEYNVSNDTYYSDDKERLEKYRNSWMDSLRKNNYLNEIAPGTFTINSPEQSITIKFGEIYENSELPSSLPPLPSGNIVKKPGTVKENGFGCKG